MKRLSIIASVLIALLVGAWWQVSYPRAWNDIHMGMTRQQVYDRLGPPEQDMGEVKGAFWNDRKLTGWQELWIYFEKDKVTMIRINRYLGTQSRYYVQMVRFEYNKTG